MDAEEMAGAIEQIAAGGERLATRVALQRGAVLARKPEQRQAIRRSQRPEIEKPHERLRQDHAVVALLPVGVGGWLHRGFQ